MSEERRARGSSPSEDDVVARLRAADPAVGAEPDLDALRVAVGERVRTDAGEDAGEVTGQAGARRTDELAAARARRWTSWPARAAAVAAAALVVGGGGGYAIGASGGGGAGADTAAEVTALPPISLDGGGRGGGAGGDSAGAAVPEGADIAAEGIAPQSSAAGDTASSAGMTLPYQSGRTVFHQSGLSDEAGTAEVWGLDAPAAYTREAAAAAAEALGVSGEPREQDWGWEVGPQDGTSATLSLGLDGTVGLSYWDPATDPWACQVGTSEAEQAVEDAAEGGGDVGIEPAPAQECGERDLGPAPDGDAAVSVLRDAMTALDVDVDAFEFAVEDWGDDHYRYVTAYHVVDGRQTGLQWSASLTGGGLQSLHGFTAPVVPLGEYAVVSPSEAADRLGDPRFHVGWGPVTWLEGRDPYVAMEQRGQAWEPTLPSTPSAGAAVSWPVDEVTIVEARLGVAHHSAPDGAAMLVPSYELVGDDGSVWSVIAVADEHLDMATGR